jgi:hypothetical protein
MAQTVKSYTPSRIGQFLSAVPKLNSNVRDARSTEDRCKQRIQKGVMMRLASICTAVAWLVCASCGASAAEWSGTMTCGGLQNSPNAESKAGFSGPVTLRIDGNKAVLDRTMKVGQEHLEGIKSKGKQLQLEGQGWLYARVDRPWKVRTTLIEKSSGYEGSAVFESLESNRTAAQTSVTQKPIAITENAKAKVSAAPAQSSAQKNANLTPRYEVKANSQPTVNVEKSLSANIGELVGKSSWEVFNHPDAKRKLEILLGSTQKDFKDRLQTASMIRKDGPWIFGEGLAAHMGGEEEAAFAINLETGRTVAAMLTGGSKVRAFGADQKSDIPQALQTWINARSKLATSGPAHPDQKSNKDSEAPSEAKKSLAELMCPAPGSRGATLFARNFYLASIEHAERGTVICRAMATQNRQNSLLQDDRGFNSIDEIDKKLNGNMNPSPWRSVCMQYVMHGGSLRQQCPPQ